MNEFELEVLRKIDNNEKLTKFEVEKMVKMCHVVEVKEGNVWGETTFIITTVEINNRYFNIVWGRGDHILQRDNYGSQPEEVELKEYERVAKVKEITVEKLKELFKEYPLDNMSIEIKVKQECDSDIEIDVSVSMIK